MRSEKIIIGVLITAGIVGAASVGDVFKSSRRMCVNDSVPEALVMLDAEANKDSWNDRDKFLLNLEKGDVLLYYARLPETATKIYEGLIEINPPKDSLGGIYYRLGFALERGEDFVGAARAYEKVVTEFSTSPYYDDALSAIERCFTKNYEIRVAEVDSYPVTELEYNEILDRMSPTERNQALTEEGRADLIDRIIYERLLKLEAQRYFASTDSTDIAIKISCLSCRPKHIFVPGPCNDPEVVSNLANMYRETLIRPLYTKEVLDRAESTDKEKKRYYKEHPDRFTVAPKYTLREVVVKDSIMLDSVKAALASGISFDSVAVLYSTAPSGKQGGLLSEHPLNLLAPEMRDAVKDMKPGEMSEPYTSSRGLEMVKLESKTRETKTPYETALPTIEELLRREKITGLSNSVLERFRVDAAVDTLARGDTLAWVAGVPVFGSDVDSYIATIGMLRPGQAEDSTFRKEVLNQIITNRVFDHELAQQKLYISDSLLNQLESARTQLLVNFYNRRVIIPQTEVAEEEITNYYNTNKKEFWHPREIKVREILVASKDTAQMVYDLLKEGSPFDSLAKAYSQASTSTYGGYVGFIKEGLSDKPYKEQAFKLDTNQVSRPIQTPQGYWLVKVERIQDSYQESLKDATSAIQSKLTRQKKEAAEEALKERLMAATKIEIFDVPSNTFPEETPQEEPSEEQEPPQE